MSAPSFEKELILQESAFLSEISSFSGIDKITPAYIGSMELLKDVSLQTMELGNKGGIVTACIVNAQGGKRQMEVQ